MILKWNLPDYEIFGSDSSKLFGYALCTCVREIPWLRNFCFLSEYDSTKILNTFLINLDLFNCLIHIKKTISYILVNTGDWAMTWLHFLFHAHFRFFFFSFVVQLRNVVCFTVGYRVSITSENSKCYLM